MRALAHACLLVLVTLVAASPALCLGSAGASDSQRARIVVTFANDPQPSTGTAGTTGRRYTGVGYVVGQSAHQKAKRIASMYGLHEVASWPIKALSIHCVVFEIEDARPVADVIAALSRDSRVALAQPLQEFHTLSDARAAPSAPPAPTTNTAPYNDPLYDMQTNLVSLDIASAHERTQGAGVRVALIDTGVDVHHPDLQGRIASTQSFVPSRPSSPRGYRHGTAMAGLIAAVANNHVGIVGIAPLAQIQVLEACWQLKPDADEAVCNTFTLAEALAAALDGGSQIVNLSIAGPADPLLTALVETGLRRGVTFVGASIANGVGGFPTGIPGVIAVGSNDRPLGSAAVGAPATHVLTLRPEAQYDFESGTSVAAAEVSGVVALLMSAAEERLAPSLVMSVLQESSIAMFTGGPSGSGNASAGAPPPHSINIAAALARLDSDQHRGRIAARGSH
jgi:subtilisin family serine protease